jgi:hypothetical protein
MCVLHVDSSSESSDVFRYVIAEDYGTHGGFAGAGFAHEEDFPLFLFSGAHGGIIGVELPMTGLEEYNTKSGTR